MTKWYASEREALMMNLTVSAKSRIKKFRTVPFTAPSVIEIGAKLRDESKNKGNKFRRKYSGGKMEIYLQDVEIYDLAGGQYIALLIALTDKRKPDQVLTDLDENVRRVFPKQNGEGLEYSMHVTIAAVETIPESGTYKLAIENVPEISAVLAGRFLRHVFRKLSTLSDCVFSCAAPNGEMVDGKPVIVPLVLTTEMRGVPSEDLLHDIERGELSEIELVREIQAGGGWDQNNFVKEKKFRLSLKPILKTEGAFVMQALRSACAKAHDQRFETATLRWKLDKQIKSAKFACQDVGLLSERYVKRTDFVLVEPLPGSCEAISPPFARQLAGWVL